MNQKKNKSAQDSRMSVVWFICMAAFICELFFYTWCRVQYTNIGYAIASAGKRHGESVALQNNLKIELERLKSPERIAKIAEKHLGLTPPGPDQMVTIK